MGKKALSGRENWQTDSGPGGRAGVAEKDLYKVFREAFKGTDYVFSEHPKQLKHLYEGVILSDETLSQIYCPDAKTMEAAKKKRLGCLA